MYLQYTMKNEHLYIILFFTYKKGAGADPQKSAPAPAQILNRLRLQPKNLGSDRLRLRNTV